jgi:hypothetical protein
MKKMKKYLMFMFGLVFAVCLVSCGGSDNKGSGDSARRQVQASPKSLEASDPTASTPTDYGTSTKDAASVVTEFNQITAGNKFVFDVYEPLDENTKCKISITRFGDDKKPTQNLVVHCDVAKWDTDDMRTNAVVIGTFDDNSKLFMVIYKYQNEFYLSLFHGTEVGCVTNKLPADNVAACASEHTCSSFWNLYKYWTVGKGITSKENKSTPQTTHPYWIWMRMNDQPF